MSKGGKVYCITACSNICQSLSPFKPLGVPTSILPPPHHRGKSCPNPLGVHVLLWASVSSFVSSGGEHHLPISQDLWEYEIVRRKHMTPGRCSISVYSTLLPTWYPILSSPPLESHQLHTHPAFIFSHNSNSGCVCVMEGLTPLPPPPPP